MKNYGTGAPRPCDAFKRLISHEPAHLHPGWTEAQSAFQEASPSPRGDATQRLQVEEHAFILVLLIVAQLRLSNLQVDRHEQRALTMDSGRILLMRHAEKSDDPLDPDLSPAGRQRAQELVTYLPNTFGMPSFLFATAFSKHSRRPYETLEPLSKSSGIPIDATFADQDYSALAYELQTAAQFNNKLVVICWHHGNIPSLAHALKAKHHDYPDPWDPSVFNLVLQLDFVSGVPNVSRVVEPF
jgi:phosphohistidine phosphatase SixA